MGKDFEEKARREGWDLENMSRFEKSDFQVSMAIDYLKKEPKSAIIKAYLFGMVKSLFAPGIIDLSYLLNIERPHFFYTEGRTFIERTLNFIRNMQGVFGYAVIGSLIAMAFMRFLQLWGFLQFIRNNIWEGLFLFLIISYFLLVSGPFGYAKYRLPFEPILIIFMAIGINQIYRQYFYRQRSKKYSIGGSKT